MKIAIFKTAALLAISITTFSQKVYYHKNTFEKTFIKCENPPTFGTDTSDLEKYLSDKLRDHIAATFGSIKASVLIDSTGKALCEWIDNTSNLKVKRAKLNDIIDSMPKWNCGIQHGHKVNCVELLVLTFNNQDLEVTYRIGYDQEQPIYRLP